MRTATSNIEGHGSTKIQKLQVVQVNKRAPKHVSTCTCTSRASARACRPTPTTQKHGLACPQAHPTWGSARLPAGTSEPRSSSVLMVDGSKWMVQSAFSPPN
eukprot:1145843-Pelagomonas_calceolata.AAC.2